MIKLFDLIIKLILRLFDVGSRGPVDISAIIEKIGDVCYDFDLVGYKSNIFAGRWQHPLIPRGSAILLQTWLKIPIDVSDLPPGVFVHLLQDERFLTRLRIVLGRNVEVHVSANNPNMSDLSADDLYSRPISEFWLFVEINENNLRGIPRYVSYDEFPSADKFDCALPIPLGLSVAGVVNYLDLFDSQNMLICGATNTGKSNYERFLLDWLIDSFPASEIQFWLLDLKVGSPELGAYADLEHCTLYDDPVALLDAIEAESDRRFRDVIAPSGMRRVIKYNASVSSEFRLPYIVVLVDEFATLKPLNNRANQLMTRFEVAASKIVGAGMFMWLCTQRPTVDIVTGSLKANFPTRVGFSFSSLVDTDTVFDIEVPEAVRVGNPGRLTALCGDKFYECQVPFMP